MDTKKIDTQKIAERFKFLMNHFGYDNERQFGIELGYERPDNIYNATSGERMPGIPLLIDISNKFDTVNIGWLLTGNGEMEIKKSGSQKKPDYILTQIKEYAEAILQLSSESKREDSPVVLDSKKALNPPNARRAKTSDKMKTDKKPKDK